MSSWIDHVKQYALNNNISYKEAMKQAKPSYTKKGGSLTALETKDLLNSSYNKKIKIMEISKLIKNYLVKGLKYILMKKKINLLLFIEGQQVCKM
jgi:hypothetical protein